MSLLARIRAFLAGSSNADPLPPRHDRRAAGRARHHASGEPAWSSDDRHPAGEGRREVQDVAPGTPGAYGSHRVIDD